jgi:antirestriction protein ArdC
MRLYHEVTARIVAELEAGAAPWLRPWKTSVANGTSLLPSNAVTGRQYHGINIPILWHAAGERGYPTHQWLTFKQAQAAGAHVQRLARATQVVFTKKLRIKDEETEEEKQISMLRGYYVFNKAQVEGLPEVLANSEDLAPEIRDYQVEAFVTRTGANIQHGGTCQRL